MADNDNFMGSTVAVAVTAAILSPRVRSILRTGAVQGLAGALIAGDAISSFARGIGRGLQAGDVGTPSDAPAMGAAQEAAQDAAAAAPAAANAAGSAVRKKASPRKRKAPTKSASTRAGEGQP